MYFNHQNSKAAVGRSLLGDGRPLPLTNTPDRSTLCYKKTSLTFYLSDKVSARDQTYNNEVLPKDLSPDSVSPHSELICINFKIQNFQRKYFVNVLVKKIQ